MTNIKALKRIFNFGQGRSSPKNMRIYLKTYSLEGQYVKKDNGSFSSVTSGAQIVFSLESKAD